jgi:hypothetical protein
MDEFDNLLRSDKFPISLILDFTLLSIVLKFW